VHILVVEDDRAIAEPLCDGLRDAGFDVTHVTRGADALQATGYDLVLLDLGLPDLDGRDVCRELRATTSAPIIMLTARSEEFDRVLGLELGADDYVTKPFSLRELVARIRAVARRTAGPVRSTGNGAGSAPSEEGAGGPQQLGPVTIDRRARRVLVHGEEVHLTAKEFDVLAFLARDPGAVRSRSEILESVWDEHWYGPTKTVDAHVASIRRKLDAALTIEAVRGVGFRLEVPR
jgi:DNA-binding response OmpR family regulator